MEMKLLLQVAILLMALLITTSEGFFFEYPKKVVSDFIHSLKAKKEAKKNPYDIHHYHVHYYPVILPSDPPTIAPKKYELENIYNHHLETLGWSDYGYKYVPEPKIKIPLNLFNSWKTSVPWQEETAEVEIVETVNHGINNDIYVEIPVKEKIVIEKSDFDKKWKKSVS
ncbi:uncharacterized protein LOC105663465 isoform X2 [Megachile rotundata]|uniref:uncharacterized protein LOC105663465 isoform X2 n=1 Tax=Megachile rotundata TaxID=143995 RepID=UPI003FD02B00